MCGPTFHGILNYAPDAQVQAFVASVVYQNGASWMVPPVAGSRRMRRIACDLVVGKHVWLLRADGYRPKSRANHPIPLACSTIENQTAKTVSDVRIVYRHLARMVRASATISWTCTPTFRRRQHENPTASASMRRWNRCLWPTLNVQEGPGLEPPVYLYKGVASALSAQVTSVAFADGPPGSRHES